MPGPEQVNTQISVPKGQAIAGNVANASTYNFPVHYKILSADPALLDLIVEGGRELEKQGVRAIVGACVGILATIKKRLPKYWMFQSLTLPL